MVTHVFFGHLPQNDEGLPGEVWILHFHMMGRELTWSQNVTERAGGGLGPQYAPRNLTCSPLKNHGSGAMFSISLPKGMSPSSTGEKNMVGLRLGLEHFLAWLNSVE